MHIFALETNVEKVKKRFLAQDEEEIFTAHPHMMSFIVHVFGEVVVTIALLVLFSGVYYMEILSLNAAVLFFSIAWFTFAFFGLIEAFLDWKYDFLMLTTDKLILVDQMSLFRKSTTPISLENLGDTKAKTQWLNLFNFGIIEIALKEGNGPDVRLKYMPHADQLVVKIAEQSTLYQRRKDFTTPYRPDTPDAA